MQEHQKSRREDVALKEKIQSMISIENVRQRVLSKLALQGINQPCITLQISDCKNEEFFFEELDILKVLECFGEVASLKINPTTALITYKDLVSAYFAIQVLNGKELSDLNVILEVSWSSLLEEKPAIKEIPQDSDDNLKYTCRFEIQIENEKEFQVARKVIGSKGMNMKRVIEKCCKGMSAQAHDIIKLRLRGRGSGFKEGPSNSESQDSLHLCVSSKYHSKFEIAVAEIENLLKKVYKEYSNFCIARGRPDPRMKLQKIEKTSGRPQMITVNKLKEIEERDQISEEEIEELIDVRNEARRQCNFAEADRIREILRKKSITLMDEKGRRGKGVEVTTWKYGKT